MTAVDVDALDKLREAATGMRHRLVAGSNAGVACSCGWFGPGSEYETHATTAIADALEPLLAEVRRGRALREAVEKLIAFYDRHEYSSLNVDDLRAVLAAGDPS